MMPRSLWVLTKSSNDWKIDTQKVPIIEKPKSYEHFEVNL